MNTVYIVLCEVAYDVDSHTYVEGVYTNEKDAQVRFWELVAEGRGEYQFDTEEFDENSYTAYNEGDYSADHFVVSIEKQDVSDYRDIAFDDKIVKAYSEYVKTAKEPTDFRTFVKEK